MNSLIECPKCRQILVEPVLLPCSHTVCKKHADEKKKLTCPKCLVEHDIPPHGFLLNGFVCDLLEREFEKIQLPVEHRVAFESMRNLRRLVEKIHTMSEHPDVAIHSVVSDLKSLIDLRREEEKKKIDEEGEKLVRELDEYERKCQASVSQQRSGVEDLQLSSDAIKLLANVERDLEAWKRELKSFRRDMNKWYLIHLDACKYYEKLSEEAERLRARLYDTDELMRSLRDKDSVLFREYFPIDPLL